MRQSILKGVNKRLQKGVDKKKEDPSVSGQMPSIGSWLVV